MLREITSEDFAKWEAYFLLEPFGPLGEDVRTARVCAAVANFSQYRKEDRSLWSPSEFMPVSPREQEPEIEGLGGDLVRAFKSAGAIVVN